MKNKKDSGFSLTEILIALVVLGIAAVAILNGLSTDTSVRGRNEERVSQFEKLVNASEIIASKQFIPCSEKDPRSENPYGQIEDIVDTPQGKGIVVDYVGPDGSWKSCLEQSMEEDGKPFADLIQRITIQIWDEQNGRQILQKREILKTYKGSTVEGSNPEPLDPLVITASKNNLRVSATSVSQCGNSDSVTLENSADLSGIIYIANLVAGSSSVVTATVDGQRINIQGLVQGSTTVEIQGVDPRNGSLSNKLNLPIDVVESFNFNPPSRQTFVAGKPRGQALELMQYVSASGAVKGNLIFGLENTSDRVNFSISEAGTGSGRLIYFNSTENAAVNPSYNLQLRIQDSRLPQTITDVRCAPIGGVADWRIKARVNSKLNFEVQNSSSGCLLSAVSTLPCSVEVKFTADTGSGENLSGVAPTNGISTIFNFSNNTLPYSGSISVGNNSACSTIQSNNTGLIHEARLASTGHLQFVLKGGVTNLLLNETLRIVNTSNSNLNSNNAMITAISTVSYTSGGQTLTGSLITTDFTPSVTSISNSAQGKFILYPLTLPSFTPVLLDTNFGNSYTVSSINQIAPIKCIDN